MTDAWVNSSIGSYKSIGDRTPIGAKNQDWHINATEKKLECGNDRCSVHVQSKHAQQNVVIGKS